MPLGVAVAGANRPDFKLARETLESVPVEWPEPTPEEPQGLSVDKGYDYEEVRELAEEFLYTLHLRTRGEEAKEVARQVGYRARRWVVERTHSWLNRFRRVLIRWEKKGENYLGMLHLACAIITFRAAQLFFDGFSNEPIQSEPTYPMTNLYPAFVCVKEYKRHGDDEGHCPESDRLRLGAIRLTELEFKRSCPGGIDDAVLLNSRLDHDKADDNQRSKRNRPA